MNKIWILIIISFSFAINAGEKESTTTTENVVQNYYLVDTVLINDGIAMAGAFASIPAPSHFAEPHGHTSIGIGMGGYEDASAMAIGMTHMINKFSFKANLGMSSLSSSYGIGAGYTF